MKGIDFSPLFLSWMNDSDYNPEVPVPTYLHPKSVPDRQEVGQVVCNCNWDSFWYTGLRHLEHL